MGSAIKVRIAIIICKNRDLCKVLIYPSDRVVPANLTVNFEGSKFRRESENLAPSGITTFGTISSGTGDGPCELPDHFEVRPNTHGKIAIKPTTAPIPNNMNRVMPVLPSIHSHKLHAFEPLAITEGTCARRAP